MYRPEFKQIIDEPGYNQFVRWLAYDGQVGEALDWYDALKIGQMLSIPPWQVLIAGGSANEPSHKDRETWEWRVLVAAQAEADAAVLSTRTQAARGAAGRR